MLGEWNYSSYLTPYDAFIFYNAIGEHENYFYKPIAVAKQLVNGTNYKFVCIAESKKANLPSSFAIVEIYKPLYGAPYTTKITLF